VPQCYGAAVLLCCGATVLRCYVLQYYRAAVYRCRSALH